MTEFAHLEAAKSCLCDAISAVMQNSYRVENPVTRARGTLKLEQNATPEMKLILQRLSALEAARDGWQRSPDREPLSRAGELTVHFNLPTGVSTTNIVQNFAHWLELVSYGETPEGRGYLRFSVPVNLSRIVDDLVKLGCENIDFK